ncbi:MAG: hypothetical protein JOZ90_06210 [Alphaproteobacteria bacterium]|nr:hypothetical protein [Alphaproteobacteria bacterium]MBV9372702.1 hypothetical protein [Alphaproteobacteria bacterium]MBV9900673.1 hypothetical protein [Alphaproteobacteria bacterium]
MKKLLSAAAAVVTVLAAPAAAADRPDAQGEAALARAIEGRVAGEPVDCIDLQRVRSTRILGHTAILYESGSTLYVNRPRGGARSLDAWDVMVTKPFGGRLCRVDVVQLYDAGSRTQSGIVFLGDFVPYKKVRQAGAR